jgi:nucleoside-diphosphate-sugar epimerase
MERDALMPERGTLSIDKAKQLIGYEPRYPLEIGYRRYIEWYRQLFDRIHTTPHVKVRSQVNE